MARGTAGLANGHHPHMSDAAILLKLSWDKATTQTIVRCWVKAETLPKKMEAGFVAKHERVGRAGSEDPMKELTDTLNKVSSRVAATKDHESPPTKIIDLLAKLDMDAGEAAGEAVFEGSKEWATFEDKEDVVNALRLDAVDEMAEHLSGTYVEDVGVSDDEEGGNDGESTGGGGIELPPFPQLSQHFGPLERAAGESGDRDSAYLLQEVKMAMIKAYASEPARKSDMREFM